jgi:hypothetical protein
MAKLHHYLESRIVREKESDCSFAFVPTPEAENGLVLVVERQKAQPRLGRIA